MLSMRNNMISVLGSDYVTLARAKGLSERRVMWSYAARNALLPNVTGLGMALGFVVSGALLTEYFFLSWRGLSHDTSDSRTRLSLNAGPLSYDYLRGITCQLSCGLRLSTSRSTDGV